MNRKEQCNKIIAEAKILGFTNEIAEGPLKNIIMHNRNIIDERSIQNWIRALTVFEYIEWKSPHVYRINNSIIEAC